jgi:hypothetical protein
MVTGWNYTSVNQNQLWTGLIVTTSEQKIRSNVLNEIQKKFEDGKTINT